MSTAATVILPTFGRADFIAYALASARRQTIAELEILVVGDGAARETQTLVERVASEDARVRFLPHPKGERHGERYRHEAIQGSTGRIVCYLGHDDLWFPHHVEVMQELLRDADFAQTLFTYVLPSGEIAGHLPLVTDAGCRARMARRQWNRFGPGCIAHRRAFYDELPHGWHAAPGHLWSDLYMWRQILAQPSCRFAAAPRTTALFFPYAIRGGLSVEQRRAEVAAWLPRVGRAGEAERVTALAVAAAGSQLLAEQEALEGALCDALGEPPRAGRPIPFLRGRLLGRLVHGVRAAAAGVARALPVSARPRWATWSERLDARLCQAMVARSGLFDARYYSRVPDDIRLTCGHPVQHFLLSGWRDGRSPSPDFDVSHYLTTNQDVFAADINPLVHYLLCGFREGRVAARLGG